MKRIFGFILIIVFLVLIILILEYPIRKSPEKIREDLLEITPIGTNMEVVLNKIRDNKWSIRHTSNEVGYEMHPIDSPNGKIYVVGEKHIRVLIGEYASPFITSVSAFWGFDEEGNLLDVYVIKETDTL